MEVGEVFGRLTVIRVLKERSPSNRKQVVCKCLCGKEIVCEERLLKRKNDGKKSCGCLRIEKVHEAKTKHGEAGGLIVGKRTKLYRTWSNMKTRCYNKKVRSYHDYGLRGIKVCEQWKNSFESFRDWSYENGYSDDLTIDRIDSFKDYCPDNCRWITATENSVRAHEKSCWGKNIENGEYVEFVNIRKFAKERGLSFSCIDRVLHGSNKTHRNWIFGYL